MSEEESNLIAYSKAANTGYVPEACKWALLYIELVEAPMEGRRNLGRPILEAGGGIAMPIRCMVRFVEWCYWNVKMFLGDPK
jgi:hypothetical protein